MKFCLFVYQKESYYSYSFQIELGHEKISLPFLFQLNIVSTTIDANYNHNKIVATIDTVCCFVSRLRKLQRSAAQLSEGFRFAEIVITICMDSIETKIGG